jgi:hypothetical protein
MVKASEFYAGRYAKASELPDNLRLPVTVSKVTAETVGQDQKDKVVIWPRAADGRAWPRGIVLNKTNQEILSAAYGDETDAWLNRPLEVWKGQARFNGQVVPSIRIDVPPPPAAGTGAIPLPGPAPSSNGAAPAPQAAAASSAAPQDPPAQADDDLDDAIPF